ncbi:MAG: hypothetical protein NTZ80_02535 [Patescibacteria group bacterium]|nr:hypothetical protein [Patescibacteria group bacterium]
MSGFSIEHRFEEDQDSGDSGNVSELNGHRIFGDKEMRDFAYVREILKTEYGAKNIFEIGEGMCSCEIAREDRQELYLVDTYVGCKMAGPIQGEHIDRFRVIPEYNNIAFGLVKRYGRYYALDRNGHETLINCSDTHCRPIIRVFAQFVVPCPDEWKPFLKDTPEESLEDQEANN